MSFYEFVTQSFGGYFSIFTQNSCTSHKMGVIFHGPKMNEHN